MRSFRRIAKGSNKFYVLTILVFVLRGCSLLYRVLEEIFGGLLLRVLGI
jgi:hypothetical protein